MSMRSVSIEDPVPLRFIFRSLRNRLAAICAWFDGGERGRSLRCPSTRTRSNGMTMTRRRQAVQWPLRSAPLPHRRWLSHSMPCVDASPAVQRAHLARTDSTNQATVLSDPEAISSVGSSLTPRSQLGVSISLRATVSQRASKSRRVGSSGFLVLGRRTADTHDLLREGRGLRVGDVHDARVW